MSQDSSAISASLRWMRAIADGFLWCVRNRGAAFGLGLVLLAAAGVGAVGEGFVGGDILFDLVGSARSAGMGGAGLALPGDDALFVNPAGLPWLKGVQLLSAYANPFGAAHVGLLSVGLPGLAGAGIVLDAGTIGPGLSFRTAGVVLGAGARLGSFAGGVRARLLRPVDPVPGLGGALDLALLWQGPLRIGVVFRSVLSQAPFPGESWPSELGVGVALPVALVGLTAAVAFDVTGIGGEPSFAIGGEFGAEWLLIRAGYGPAGVTLGGEVRWGLFGLDWALIAHPVLPPAFRVSFTVRL